MQVLYEDHLIIVDTGFGVTNLGEELMKRILAGDPNLTIHIFFTHFHWDHIQGLPFFHPIYFPTSTIILYSPASVDYSLENLNLLFDGSYSPFEGIRNMPSKISFVELGPTTNLHGLTIEHTPVDHGSDAEHHQEQTACAYKFTAPTGECLVIATDHEARRSATNDNLVSFAKNSDLLVHDGQYLESEYPARTGWGHSSVTQALENALKSGTGKTLLTHHDPSRTDSEIQDMYRDLRANTRFKRLKFEFAREDLVYSVVKSSSEKKVG
jgi:ribonuclease BN (tRNA processing enzyme)